MGTKVSKLVNIRLVVPGVKHVLGGDVAHIVEKAGDKQYKNPEGKLIDERRYVITRCNRALKWGLEVHSLNTKRLCARCGNREAFEDAMERGNILRREGRERAENERRMKNAQFDAEIAWDETWKAVNDAILEDAQAMVEDGKVLIPLSQTDLDLIWSILQAFKNSVEKESMKDETLVQTYYHANRLLEDVLIS
jgi:hypothetical protein